MQLMQLPPRPKMPTSEEDHRVLHTSVRLAILDDEHEFEKTAELWAEQHIDPERLANRGPLDLSANPLADLCRQLSTPGLYGHPPAASHPDPAGTALLGRMARAGYWTRMQRVEYLTRGAGDYFLHLDWIDGALVLLNVPPCDVHRVPHPKIPHRAQQFWWLRVRVDEKKPIYTWDVYDLGHDGSSGESARPPSYRIHKAAEGGLGEDLSGRYLDRDYSGDAYPWRTEAGAPRLPFVHYQDADSGALWNTYHKRGVHRGTLQAALNWTFTGWCALNASGSSVMAWGLRPIGVDIQGAGTREQTRRVQLDPGSMLYHEVIDGAQPGVHEAGAGANLTALLEYASVYEAKQAARWGLSPSDVSRQNATPHSGAALFVSNRGKREAARQLGEIFRLADADALACAASVLRAAGQGAYPDAGYSLAYQEIPDSPEEEREKREQIQWEEERGYLSPLEAYRRLHPGTDEAAAAAAIVAAAVDRRRLEVLTASALAAAGLQPTPPNNPEFSDV